MSYLKNTKQKMGAKTQIFVDIHMRIRRNMKRPHTPNAIRRTDIPYIHIRIFRITRVYIHIFLSSVIMQWFTHFGCHSCLTLLIYRFTLNTLDTHKCKWIYVTVYIPCKSNPCMSEGSCIKNGDGFKCHCKLNYEGETCQCGYFVLVVYRLPTMDLH